MTFRDDMLADLDVFLNSDEFADEHEIGGQPVMASVEWSSELSDDGLTWLNKATVQARESDLDLVPGQRVSLDGELVDVEKVDSEAGMLVVVAYKYEA